ncbi:hypothetical protein CAEBREN_13423 [Caenorhabditis brenneri]|uniref:Uncharacterized protein n=1 Tax=Caenorhabditis brenneri TaxID=135651 RepID=G0MNQ8_CAEBE|nr:hypothetical protein CAEBREN_13423 [Caenorhabditis brenneri]
MLQMSPNGTSSSSICCCSRYFRRSNAQQNEQSNSQNTHLEPIEIKVNGQPHLMVPHVALRPSNSAPTVSTAPITLAPDTLSEINLELFETARTSRTNDSKLHPMRELIRFIRIEEGLEVTPRVDTIQPSTSSAIKNTQPMETIPEIPKHSKPRKAVFNEDGDISSRTNISHPKETVFSVTNTRRVSIESIDIPIITVPLSSSSGPSNQSRAMVRSSSISRRISSTPQMITAFVAYSYAIFTAMLTTFTNLFSK